MNTTVELPEATLRLAEQVSAQRGFTVPDFIAYAVENEAAQAQPTHYRGVPLTPKRRRQLAIAKKIMHRDAAILKALAQ